MDPIISTERTYIVAASFDYTRDINKHFSPNVTKYMLATPHSHLDETHQMIERWLKKDSNNQSLHLVILDKNEHFLGATGYTVLSQDAVELGLWLIEEVWNQGIGFEVLKALIDFAFHQGYQTLVYPLLNGNVASTKLCKKLGGVFIRNYFEEDMNGNQRLIEEYRIIKK